MGPSRTLLVVVILLGAAAFASFQLYGRRTAVEPVRLEPLKLPLRMPSGGFLEDRIAEIATIEKERVGEISFPVEENPTDLPANDPSRDPSESATAGEKLEGGRLKQTAKEFAYTRYGKIGNKGIATLMDLRSYETTTKTEGASYRGISIAQIEENSILLTYPGEGELRKPRIELDVEPLDPGENDPARAQALWTRHQELWGNRSESGASETPFSHAGQAFTSEDLERQLAARKRYLEKMSDFHRRLEAEDPTLDPSQSPLLPTAGEVARDSLQKAQETWKVDEAHSEGEVNAPQGADQP